MAHTPTDHPVRRWLGIVVVVLYLAAVVTAYVLQYIHYRQWFTAECGRDSPYCNAGVFIVAFQTIIPTLLLAGIPICLVLMVPAVERWRSGRYDGWNAIGRCLLLLVITGVLVLCWRYVAVQPWMFPR